MFDIKKYIIENVSTVHISEANDATSAQARQAVRTARVAVTKAYRSLRLTMASKDHPEITDIVDAFRKAINILQSVE